MPFFNKSPFAAAVKLLYAGVAEYLFGSWKQDASPAQIYVTSVAVTANVATLGVVIFGGDAPAVGSKISVQGSQTNGGIFNVVNAVLTAVSPTVATTGTGTVSFALVNANVGTVADVGIAIVPIPEVAEAIVAGASIPVAMSNNSAGGDLDKTVGCSCLFPVIPTAVTVSLQGSHFNDDAQFVTVGTIATVAGSAVTANGLTFAGGYLFYRALISGLTGAGTILCKIIDD